MPFTGGISAIAEALKKELVTKIVRKKDEIEYWSGALAQAQYAEYPKQPVDTGASLSKTSAKLTATGTGANLQLKIDTSYSSFFADPQSSRNSNFKYGKRNPLKDSWEKHSSQLVSRIINDE
jgi:hypothetical protein